jgi:cobyrinic acid a,c-diamide synthase
MARLLISAAGKSSGKTVLGIGLGAAFAGRGLAVQPFKKGPDYIDPMWLALAAGRPCRNLDYNTQSPAEIAALFGRHARTCDLALIEGNKGLYDGTDLGGANSTAALARLLAAPVLLVVDAQGITRGVAPLLLGYRAFGPDVTFAGVVLNKVATPRHEGKLVAAIERYTDFKVLGALHRDARLAIRERHLGLIPANEAGAAATRVERIAAAVAAGLDLDAILAAARRAPTLDVAAADEPAAPRPDLRIGIARDAAFGFYYADDLEAFRRAGAELVPIDMLHAPRLPEIDGLFIGGGFPETQAAALESNRGLRRELRRAIAGGLPVYAECGGAMYLARAIVWRGRRYEMVGAVPADAVMTGRPVGRGLMRLRETGEGLWPLRDSAGRPAEFAAHEFHHSRLVDVAGDIAFAYEVLRGHGINGRRDGIVHRNVVASYAHLRHVAANPWADRFVRFVREVKARRGAAARPAPARPAAMASDGGRLAAKGGL